MAGLGLASMVINHFGLIRQKSVRVFVLSDFLGSKTTGPFGLRQKTTQCQKGRPLSRCHEIPPVFSLPRAGVHATNFSFC